MLFIEYCAESKKKKNKNRMVVLVQNGYKVYPLFTLTMYLTGSSSSLPVPSIMRI